jgi:hypothetical protein
VRLRLGLVLIGVFAAAVPSPTAAAAFASRNPHVVATVQVFHEGSVSAVVAGFRSAWVSVYPNSDQPFVARVDAATKRVIASVHVGSVPGWVVGGGGMAIGHGAVWLVGEQRFHGRLDAVLERIDPTTNRLTGTIPLGGRLGADVMAHGPFVWSVISTQNGSRIVKVDPATNRVVARIPLEGSSPRRIFAADGAIWVYDTQGLQGAPNGTLRRIDPSTGMVVDTVPLANYVGDAVPRGHVIWIERGGDLVRLRASSGEFIGEPVHVAKCIRATQMVAGDGGVWFSGYDPSHASVHDVIHRYDPSTGRVDVSVEDAHGPSAMALAPRSLWVLNYDGTLEQIDLG